MHGDITALYYMLYCTLSQGLLLVRVSLNAGVNIKKKKLIKKKF